MGGGLGVDIRWVEGWGGGLGGGHTVGGGLGVDIRWVEGWGGGLGVDIRWVEGWGGGLGVDIRWVEGWGGHKVGGGLGWTYKTTAIEHQSQDYELFG